MKALFIADAHLKNSHDANYQKLLMFLASLVHPSEVEKQLDLQPTIQQRIPVDDLYIGGDFFDFWFCRGREVYPEFVPVISALTAIRDRGIRVHFAEGNHDFFLADYFTRMLGMEVYPEWGTFMLDDCKVLFSHGDTVDRQNVQYLRLRKLLRSAFVYQLQRRLPLSLLWKIAGAGSAASKGTARIPEEKLAEILHAFSAAKLRREFDAVILGHCHQPIMKEYSIGSRKRYSITLGDWIRHFSYLYYEDGNFRLCFFEA
ncbi:UDP-2,3-diacylglucosamine hydrolase [Syntrophus gentianae]|uniref:UDP-2,3-diacylglucosamine hydrolase n=1 Tax=Syntrophus gentianae TaxID=43775 RepID=A0A1H7WBQ2_9BACT|nr:UDP-2,3-diacylglucosamine diphosphatase [Syntrophus gentianae]SEM18920.1 UDP-2,3-diacylglucosamine hydrolase [Syntrophus gentianae]